MHITVHVHMISCAIRDRTSNMAQGHTTCLHDVEMCMTLTSHTPRTHSRASACYVVWGMWKPPMAQRPANLELAKARLAWPYIWPGWRGLMAWLTCLPHVPERAKRK
ncbi:hypothetical protein C2857_007606 [Epichloe festucae Fl1]|uniref:Uncharacterized protein n=1 Tax=Epichloe festucae (strain Fl1) TaxID=877507 RepID=A0A7S9PUT0_EPIFF|nr:hypothetical protein C2857_007606 [Epichloe festucae Fl1]